MCSSGFFLGPSRRRRWRRRRWSRVNWVKVGSISVYGFAFYLEPSSSGCLPLWNLWGGKKNWFRVKVHKTQNLIRSECIAIIMYVCLSHISYTVYPSGVILGFYMTGDPIERSVKFNAIRTHNMFNINKLYVNQQSWVQEVFRCIVKCRSSVFWKRSEPVMLTTVLSGKYLHDQFSPVCLIYSEIVMILQRHYRQSTNF